MKLAVQDNAPNAVSYLLERGADASVIERGHVIQHGFSIRVVTALLQHGWDINTRKRPYSPLLWRVVGDYDLVYWCLEHGANVHPSTPPSLCGKAFEYYLHCQSVLQSAAESRTLETFELLRSRGAPNGYRMPRGAVQWAYKRTEPTPACEYYKRRGDGKEKPRLADSWEERMRMVRFLVEDEGLDVNGSDQPSPKHNLPQHFGKPLAYVMHFQDSDPREVVWYLLDHGADPTEQLEGSWGHINQKVVDAVRE